MNRLSLLFLHLLLFPLTTFGLEWALRQSGAVEELGGIAYGNGQYVVVGENAVLLTSPDGGTWTQPDSGPTDRFSDLEYLHGLYVGLSYDGHILTSSTGSYWVDRSAHPGKILWKVCQGAGLLVAVGGIHYSSGEQSSLILTSPNGLDWTPQASPDLVQKTGVAYGNGRFVAIGDDGLHAFSYMSANGVDWITSLIISADFQDGRAYVSDV